VLQLRNQLGNLHNLTITSLPLAPVVSLFGFFFLVGVVFDKIWTSRKTNKQVVEIQSDIRPQVPTSLSQFLEKDLWRKESVEWVNMVLSKLWKVYRLGLENWLVGLLQPIIDDLKKPAYVLGGCGEQGHLDDLVGVQRAGRGMVQRLPTSSIVDSDHYPTRPMLFQILPRHEPQSYFSVSVHLIESRSKGQTVKKKRGSDHLFNSCNLESAKMNMRNLESAKKRTRGKRRSVDR
jgi:hypothetical protein